MFKVFLPMHLLAPQAMIYGDWVAFQAFLLSGLF